MPNTVYAQMENKQHSTVVLPKESFENEYQRFIIDATNETGDYVVENAVGLREHIEALGAVCEIINFVDAQHIVYVVNVPRLCEVVVLQIRGRHAVAVDGKNESLALDKHIQLVCVFAASGIGFGVVVIVFADIVLGVDFRVDERLQIG